MHNFQRTQDQMAPKFISIAMASYNGAAYIETQIHSLLSQHLAPAEIIIVDDQSNDGTVAIIEALQLQYPIIKLYRNTKNIGPVGSFKKAVSLCTHEIVALCDQDDIWKPEKLKDSLEALDKLDPDLPAMVFTDLELIDTQALPIAPSFWGVQGFEVNKVDFRSILARNVVTGCTILMNGGMKKEVARMPAQVAMHDHWLALIAYGFGAVTALPTATIRYRQHLNSVTLKQKKTFLQRLILLYENLLDRECLYLKAEIEQALLFEQLYGANLTASKKQELVSFNRLASKSSAQRKLYAAMLKLKQR